MNNDKVNFPATMAGSSDRGPRGPEGDQRLHQLQKLMQANACCVHETSFHCASHMQHKRLKLETMMQIGLILEVHCHDVCFAA